MKMFFLTCFTQYCLSFYDKVFSLFWLNIKLFKVSILNSQIFLWPVLLLLWTKVIYNEVNNKNIIKRRRSRPEVFCKKGVVRNVAKFTGKQLYHSLFLMAQVFPCEFCEILKNTFLKEHLRWLLLKIGSKTKKQHKRNFFPAV